MACVCGAGVVEEGRRVGIVGVHGGGLYLKRF